MIDARWALGLFLCLTLPVILTGSAGHDGLAYDAVTFHLPQINYFLAHPGNLLNYPATATTLPLYHALMGVMGRLAGLTMVDNSTLVVRLVHFMISAAGLILLTSRLRCRLDAPMALLLALPLATCWYVISGAVYFGTDGPALTLVLIALLDWEKSRLPAQALLLLLVAGTRHLLLPFVGLLYGIRALAARSPATLIAVGMAAMPAVLMLAIYIRQWGGLTPPGMVAALNPKGLFPYALLGHLGVAGMWGVGFGALRFPQWTAFLVERKIQIALVALNILVLTLWAIVPTDPIPEAGRFGSITWSLARVGLFGHHSVAVLIMAMAGATTLLLMALDLKAAGQLPSEIMALAGFLCALMLTYAAYQRYSEPMILAVFTVASIKTCGRGKVSFGQALPLLGLCLLSIGVSLHHLLPIKG
ncbi:hypothetical protein [Novosphingobium sp. KACC 22771]|uniref:hypothetical protein n=1 Tax=Novosphingobium sp. KACC 22771 TaxID=3025670 RepID=UPI0023651392|nr:hypothetical protein [Novosphingobium sp. KACC 22771]WDF72862.1 hypothetical protein PQ467_02130 [Novosphingobium sp. KACC 22771]